MKHKKLLASTFFASTMGIMVGCGEDPGMYQNETINFTSPVNAKMEQKSIKKENDLDLKEQDSSNFFLTRYGAYVPWAPVPLFDYYREPIPVEIPVSPFYSLIDYVHPFYAAYLFDDWDDDR